MGEWQDKELRDWMGHDPPSGARVRSIVVMLENRSGAVPRAEDLARWESELGFTADALLVDPGRVLYDAYTQALEERVSEAVTVVIDRRMQIRRVGATYDMRHELNLDLLLRLANSPEGEPASRVEHAASAAKTRY